MDSYVGDKWQPKKKTFYTFYFEKSYVKDDDNKKIILAIILAAFC
jgi:hypothetical protein